MKVTDGSIVESSRRSTDYMISQMELYFAALEWKYHFYLFLSGICLLMALGKLGWAAGFSWLFFSKVLAMVMAKVESMITESDVMKSINSTLSNKISFNSWN